MQSDRKTLYSVWDFEDLVGRTHAVWDQAVVAIGTFDGVHLGHQTILHKACSLAEETNSVPIALTFDRHPMGIIAKDRKPEPLITIDDKVKLIVNCGIRHVVVVRFTSQFAQIDPIEFLKDILVGGVGAHKIVVGFDFKFGKAATGDVNTLSRHASEFGYDLTVVSPVTDGNRVISSTHIRSLIRNGDVGGAAALFGRPYCLNGTVVHGDARGRTIGFPTANVEAVEGELLVPGDGVYVSEIVIPGAYKRKYNALTVIGTRPSFTDDRRVVESFLFGFSGNLYGKSLHIRFLDRLRNVVRFDTPDQLVRQIQDDVRRGKAYFERQQLG